MTLRNYNTLSSNIFIPSKARLSLIGKIQIVLWKRETLKYTTNVHF